MVRQFFLKRRMEIRIFLFLCPFQFLEFITCHQIQFKFPVDLKLCTDGRREVKASVCFSVCGKRPTDMTFQIRSQSPGLRYIKLRTGIKRNEQLLINRKSATRTDGKPLTDVVVTAALVHYCVKGIEVPYIRGHIGANLDMETRKRYVANIVFGALHRTEINQ